MGIPQQLQVPKNEQWLNASRPVSPSATNRSDGQLEVAVIFTCPEATIRALRRTGALLRGLNARIDLIATQTVPYPLAVDNPPISVGFSEARLLDVARRSQVETTVSLYLCRSRLQMLTSVLNRGSLVVLGTRKTWLPTWEQKLARKLECAGHRVILVELS